MGVGWRSVVGLLLVLQYAQTHPSSSMYTYVMQCMCKTTTNNNNKIKVRVEESIEWPSSSQSIAYYTRRAYINSLGVTDFNSLIPTVQTTTPLRLEYPFQRGQSSSQSDNDTDYNNAWICAVGKDIIFYYDITCMSVGYVVSPFKSIITDQPQQQQHQQYNNNAISDIYTRWWWWCGDCGCCCHCYIKYSGHHHLCTRIERRTIKVILFILCTLDKNKRVSFVRSSVTDGD